MTTTVDARPKLSPKQLRKMARERFVRSRKATSAFHTQLTKLGKTIGTIVDKHAPGGKITNIAALRKALTDYSKLLKPWATSLVTKMHAEIDQRDAAAWTQASRAMGQSLRKEIATAPIGQAMRQVMQEQVKLITSLPVEAAERVHKLTIEGVVRGTRSEDVAKAIMESGHVSTSRARLIARTEVARTSSVLTETRARHIGSEGYIWRTSLDPDVRPALNLPAKQRAHFVGSHRKLEGTYHRWDEPPVSGQHGERAHPGQIYNCRCWPEPVLPDRI